MVWAHMTLKVINESRPKTSRGHLWLTLFGLIFLLPGLFVAWLQIDMIYKSVRAGGWADEPAQVISAKLDYSRSSEGGTTYRAQGHYSYEWQGKTYISDVLFYSPGYDSGKKFHRKIVSKLSAAKSGGETLVVKVNPKKPGQAVAFPAIRWGYVGLMSIFSLLFGGGGAGIIFAGFYTKKSGARENTFKLRHPNAPWLWRDIWQSPKVKSDSKQALFAILGFTLVWNLISWPMLIPLTEVIKDEGILWLLLFYLFPVIGLIMIRMTWRSYLQWKRFGKAYYELETYPAAPGHAHMGVLHIPGRPPRDLTFKVKLRCLCKEERGSGDDRKTVEIMIWEDEQIIPASAGIFMSVFTLPVRFNLPEDAKTTSIEYHENYAILWKVSFEAEHGDVEFDQDFEIPVFDPQEYPFQIRAKARGHEVERKSEYTYEGDWQKTGVIHSGNIDSGYYYFPPARHKGTAIAMTVIALGLNTVTFGPLYSDVPVFVGVVFGVFAAVFTLFAMHLWFFKSAVDVKAGQMLIRRGLFRGKLEDVGPGDVKGFELSKSMSSGETQYYDIVALLTSGKKLKLADHLLGKRDVEALMTRMWQDFRKPV